MLLPPVLEVHVLWHPGDQAGKTIADALLDHFHGPTFAGLAGGAVEVYIRSAGWETEGGPPRPLPFVEPPVNGVSPPAVTVVVPVLGTRLARAAEDDPAWRAYLDAMVTAAVGQPVGIFSVVADPEALTPGGALHATFGAGQSLDKRSLDEPAVLCRDLTHSIAGVIGDPMGDRLRVFISHTKRFAPAEGPDAVDRLVHLVREVIASTHLSTFFDQADLLPGSEWEAELEQSSATSALLAVRTDLYTSRAWCQREVLVAKRADMPVVVLSALTDGEHRGSFLMDHVPAIPLRGSDDGARRASIERALGQLVDEALKRALWRRQRAHLDALGFDWLPANAPEPLTLASWLGTATDAVNGDDQIFVLHPDPPLGQAEGESLGDVLALAGLRDRVEILTPRTFASRGGQVQP